VSARKDVGENGWYEEEGVVCSYPEVVVTALKSFRERRYDLLSSELSC
jgi:hypothetical protein